MNQETILQRIIAHILGHKYYAAVVNTRGTKITELACFIFHTKEEAEEYRDSLITNATYMHVETISFRSRKEYPKQDGQR